MLKSIIVVLISVVGLGVVYEKIGAEETIAYSNTYGYVPDSGFYKKQRLEFVYKVESRFIETITRERIMKAKTVRDIFPVKSTLGIDAFENVSLAVIKNKNERSRTGPYETLNPAQLQMLQSTDYSDHIHLRALYKAKNDYTGELYYRNLTYYLTVVPEKEAEYRNGKSSFISYLKSNSIEKTLAIDYDKVQAGRINFTVSKTGKVQNIKLESSSGYPALDDSFLDLIEQMPGNWEPAASFTGKKVDQEMVFFFGSEGC